VGRISNKTARQLILELRTIPQNNMSSFLTRNIISHSGIRGNKIELCEYQTLLSGGMVPRHRHEEKEELFYICRGKGRLTVNTKTAVISAGAAVHIPAHSWHNMVNEWGDVLEYILIQVSVSQNKN
jgi:mannose-6-phosphate isomerase-like protein (cupin superfamily)